MAEGKVTAWSPHKGIGVIDGDDGTQAFVHHTQIATPGFKDLAEGQRVRYEVQSDARGSQAIKVVPLPLFELDLSPEEWKRMGPFCAANGIEAKSRNSVDSSKRPRIIAVVDLKHQEALTNQVVEIQADLKKEQPKNPVFIVDFQFDEGEESGWCAVGAGTPEEAETLAKSKLKELVPQGVSDGEIVESMTLEQYEEETGRTLPLGCFPKSGEVVPLG